MHGNSLHRLLAFAACALPSLGLAHSNVRELSFPQMLKSSTTYSDATQLQEAEQELWQRYLSAAQDDAPRLAQHSQRALTYGDKRMRFSLEQRGSKPAQGYPVYIALHGGGGAPARVNDSQWQHMQVYYKESVTDGLYVAPRGITDTWNLHFVPESFPLYDRLIENLIAYEGADPNRIYLLGFSAGGDGVYQVVPTMANRFAAANMSAGHHNWIRFDNLFNTPFLMQVGEFDSAYNRNKVAAQNYLAMSALQQKYQGGYLHELFIHPNYGHNGWPDHNESGEKRPIIMDPQAWLERNDRTTTTSDTDAVHWLNRHVRTPRPSRIIWDIATRGQRSTSWGASYAGTESALSPQQNLFYWLAFDGTPGPKARLEVRRLAGKNMIVIDHVEDVTNFRLLLHRDDYNFAEPVRVYYRDRLIAEKSPTHKLQVMARTLLEHGDRSLVFDDEIAITIAQGEQGQEEGDQNFTYCSNGRCFLMNAEEFQRIKNYPPELHYHCVEHNHYALSFDDGPTTRMPEVLAKLAEWQIPATFFVVGSRISSDELRTNLRNAHAQGHEIANHSYSHRNLADLNEAEVRAELSATQRAILETIGDTPATRLASSIMRPPFGAINPQVQAAVNELGFSSVRWNSDRYDWELRDEQHALVSQRIDQHLAFLAAQTNRRTLQRSILDLNHEFSRATLTALATAVPKLKALGYKFVTMSQCIGKSPRP